LNEAFPKRKHYIVDIRRVKTLYFFLLCKTRLIKATSWRCCGKAHVETYNAFTNFVVLC